ncbi:hypothetical protein RSAG8_03800, partial [Rhizoctonia solani AG-8 WAC10335]
MYLDMHIKCGIRALTLGLSTDADTIGWLNNLGTAFWTRSWQLGQLSNLDIALDYLTRAKQLLPQNSMVLPDILHNIGNCFLQWFKCHSAKADINLAFEHHQQVMVLTPEETPEMAHQLNSLSLVLQQCYHILGDSNNLDNAVDYQKKAVRLMKEGDLEMPGRLRNLGVVYEARFE